MINYLRSWNLMRVIRLAVGIFIVVQGIIMKEWMFIGLGALFTIMPLLNVGCSVGGTCSRPMVRHMNEHKETTYTEVK